MRILLFLLAFLVSFSPLLAQPLVPRVESAVRQNLLPPRQKVQTPHKEPPDVKEAALQRLATLQDPINWKHISWQEFLKLNKHTKEVEHVSIDLDMVCADKTCQLLPGPIPLEAIQQTENSEPDYKTFLAGQKLIFVGEVNHSTKRAPQEMAKILHAVREANPHAKILLAAEFLDWISPYNVLGMRNIKKDLSFKINQYMDYYHALECETATDPKVQEICNSVLEFIDHLKQERENPTALIKQAGQESQLYSHTEYQPVFQAADALGIDQLALDDYLVGEDNKNKLGVKVGEYVIEITPQDNVPFVIGQKKRKNYRKKNAKQTYIN